MSAPVGGHEDKHVNVICEAADKWLHCRSLLTPAIVEKFDQLFDLIAMHDELCIGCVRPKTECTCEDPDRAYDSAKNEGRFDR